MDSVNVGDFVGWDIPDSEGDARAIGIVRALGGPNDSVSIQDIAQVEEVWAYHRIWGGSTNSRGKKIWLPITELRSCPNAYRHICKEHEARLKKQQASNTNTVQ